MTPVSHGKPCAGNPHARFDEGASASEEPRRNALLHKKIPRNEFAVLNVVMCKETYRRIEDGTQKVVFEYPERKRDIEHWYAKSVSKNLRLVVKVWCEKMKKGNRHISFICDVIWDDENWSWMGWMPEEKFYDEFDEPMGNHYVLYLGDRIN